MRINVTDVDQYMEDTTLDEALYTVEVVDADLLTTKSGYEQLMLRLTIVDGPTQMNGKSAIGEEVTDFILLDENASIKPRGIKFIRERVGALFASFGVDPSSDDEHDFIGKRAIAKIRPGEDLDGFPRNEVRRYKKALD